jgi:hypothetical protein
MYSERERGGRVQARRGKGLASMYVLHLAMYTVPNLLGGSKVRVVTERNGVLFDIWTDYL